MCRIADLSFLIARNFLVFLPSFALTSPKPGLVLPLAIVPTPTANSTISQKGPKNVCFWRSNSNLSGFVLNWNFPLIFLPSTTYDDSPSWRETTWPVTNENRNRLYCFWIVFLARFDLLFCLFYFYQEPKPLTVLHQLNTDFSPGLIANLGCLINNYFLFRRLTGG